MKYLFNCLSDPRRATRLIPDLWRNRIERNPGDLAYEYAVMNALATDESVEFVPTGYYHFRGFSDARVEWINATCKAFVCPLADVFADDFLPFVRRLTELVKRLRIPCIVPCVGLRAVTGDWSTRSPDFAETVSAFARAVLDKSAKIGLRGDTTARYLQKLGFSPDRHLSVVGCPTLYTYGKSLPVRALASPATLERCVFHMNVRADPADWTFIDRVASQFRKSVFVSQYWQELFHFMLTDGKWRSPPLEAAPQFRFLLEKYARGNRMRFFLNRKPWMDLLRSADVSFGHRIHGALLSILAGTPAVVVPFESRTEELARFHGIPTMTPEANGDRPDVRRLFDSLDFAETGRRQAANFANWASFLRENGLDTVFAHTGASIPDRNGFPLERNLPDAYPDDNLRAWSFNPPAARLRIGIAMAPEMAAGPILRNARRLKRIIGGRREKPN